MPYSSTWNMQIKVALDTLKQMQTGLRLHNAFIHWRQAGDEVGCSLLYFIVALLDKWNSLLAGGRLLGLSAQNTKYRMPVGFALAYYLIGAVLLDLNAAKLHTMTAQSQNMLIGDVSSIPDAVNAGVKARKKFVLEDVGTIYDVSFWSLAIASSLLWVAILSDSEGHPWSKISQDRSFHEYTSPGREVLLSQDELRITFENLEALDEDEKYEVDPTTHPGLEIKSILTHAIEVFEEIKESSVESIPNFALKAFPEAKDLLMEAIAAFENRKIVVECVSMSMFSHEFKDLKAVSCDSNDLIRVIVGCEAMDAMEQQSSISIFCQTTAEILLHLAAESFQRLSHEDATLLESLLSSVSPSGLLEHTPIPQGLRNFLNFSKPSRSHAEEIASCFEDEILCHTAVGYNPNIDWESLPTEIRELILDRCTGQIGTLTIDQQRWIRTNQLKGLCMDTFLTRHNFGAFVANEKKRYTLDFAKTAPIEMSDKHEKSSILNLFGKTHTRKGPSKMLMRRLKSPFSTVYHKIGHCLKLFAIAFVAEPELQRELDYTMQSTPKYIRLIVMFLVTGIWSYAKFLQDVLMPMFLLHGRKNVETLWKQIRGTTVSLKRQKIMIESTGGASTAFVRVPDTASITGSNVISRVGEDTDAVQESLLGSGICELRQYSGALDQEPDDGAKLERISIYNKDLLLLRREDYFNGAKSNVYEYEYDLENIPRQKINQNSRRYPISRRCIQGENELEEVSFNSQGLVQSGSYILDGNLVRFNCHYRQNSNFDDELLRAEFVLPHMFCMVSWAAPPVKHQDKLDTWIPHSQVLEATFVIGPDVYESQWSYDHKYHPSISTTLNGEPVDTPPLIEWDHLGILKKPTNHTFRHDDHMIGFKSLLSTSRARSRLWQAWKNNSAFDGVIMRWLDERLLRQEPMLRPYFRRRDHGNLKSAEEYLHENADAIMAAVDLDKSISGWAPLAFQIADLYAFGQGGSANARTRSAPEFKSDELHVLATDSGTWPNEGGGVSACRRDMVNNLKAARWYMIAESANDFGVPKHQTQENVQTLKVIPIWGLDFMTPTHGIFRDRLDSEVVHAVRDPTKLDIKKNFVPILKALVKERGQVNIRRTFSNPGWEVEIGSHQGKLEHRNIFKRKIDPVVNGIPPADISKFSPIKDTTSPLPTVTMLSHVWYAKDIKTAILAADIIVNVWGFKDYRLDIYGAIDKAPQYSTDCFEILASKSLPGYVNLCGTASPTAVLKKTWVFLNSSISEGLPLALGEAALTGAPVRARANALDWKISLRLEVPLEEAKPRLKSAMPSLPLASNIWGQASVPSALQTRPLRPSIFRGSSMIARSMQASTVVPSPGIERPISAMGYGGGIKGFQNISDYFTGYRTEIATYPLLISNSSHLLESIRLALTL
ncbi:hypothetical protein DID88_003939 [Monilinia fructigena]|uniref:Uncharacterized protein n=1 Tax=Monilinia fructigena TaxID=38457 RepID=A0A395IYV9_9HELO|nr:hypothetical protein DID88_003939 [Monilinia fructigena]